MFKRLTQGCADKARGAFGGFQRNIACKSVGYDHIDPVLWDIPTLDKAYEFKLSALR